MVKIISLLAVAGIAGAETVALTYNDCGSSSTHVKITGLKPETIDVPGKASVIGSGNLDADQTSASFSLKVKKAGIPLVSGKGSICEDTTIKVPLGAGSFTVKGIDCPIKTGNVDVQVDLDILSELVEDGENNLLSIHIDAEADDTGDQVICLDVDASLASDMESKDTCSLYSIDGDTCGQSDLDCDYVKYAKAAEKSLQDGTCADQGFSVKTGSQTKSYTVIGDIVITTYSKGFDVGETVALTYKDCGSSSTHVKITGLKPETIDVPGKASVIGSGNLDADQTSASFSLKVKKAGIPLVSGKGSICEDTTIKVPLGAGSFTVKGIDCPIKTGNVDVQVDLDILSELVEDGENNLLSIHIDANADDTGDQVICLDVDASLASFQV